MVTVGEKTGAGDGVGRSPRVTAAQWTQSSQETPGPEGGVWRVFMPVQTSSKATRTRARALRAPEVSPPPLRGRGLDRDIRAVGRDDHPVSPTEEARKGSRRDR